MKIKIMKLDENLKEEVQEYEIEVEQPSAPESGEESDSCDEKTLASIDLPDGISCTWNHGCRVRMRTHRLYAQVCYPSDVEQALRDAVSSCFDTAVKAAIVAAGITLITPASLEGAVGAAGAAFEAAFIECMGDKLSNAIHFKVDYESHS
ncbi:TPA: hypothetical protein QCQ09_004125 [Bacillus cereus]|nr:hypothetical protein [Bacillus cereus]